MYRRILAQITALSAARVVRAAGEDGRAVWKGGPLSYCCRVGCRRGRLDDLAPGTAPMTVSCGAAHQPVLPQAASSELQCRLLRRDRLPLHVRSSRTPPWTPQSTPRHGGAKGRYDLASSP